MKSLALASSMFFLLAGSAARADEPGRSYFSIEGEVYNNIGTYELHDAVFASGLALKWGSMQSRYFGEGFEVSLSRADPSMVPALLIGSGPEAHIALGSQFLLIPAAVIGLRIGKSGETPELGYGINASVTLAAKFDTNWAGLKVETPLFLSGGTSAALPGTIGIDLAFGWYYQ